MLNANESRKKAKENLEKGLTDELQNIEKLIDNAVNEGKYQVVFVNDTLRNGIEAQLKKLGYEIVVGGRFKRDTIIKW